MRARSFFNNLREASFRGARFEVDEVEASGGRRVVLHEYPLRDTPYSEDLGRRAREFSVRGYIIQGRTYDYASARADVLKALEAYGPGELVHPWHGEVNVVVDDYRLRESMERGGLLELDIHFREAGQLANPTASADTAKRVASAASSARQALKNSFYPPSRPPWTRSTKLSRRSMTRQALPWNTWGCPKALLRKGLPMFKA